MPFALIKGKYRSPSGRVFTRRQTRWYYDAKRPRLIDPTNTGELRAKFRMTASQRLQSFIMRLREHILDNQRFSNVYDTATALKEFNHFAYSAAYAIIVDNANWLREYVNAAYKSGTDAVMVEGWIAPVTAPNIAVYYEEYKADLEGIVDEALKQMSRVASEMLITRVKPIEAYRQIREAFDKVAITRMSTMCNSLVVRLHNKGRIDQYVASGLGQFTVRAEGVPKTTKSGDSCCPAHVRLRDKFITPQKERKLLRSGPKGFNEVAIMTMRDEEVCPECDEFEGDVMDVHEAERLLPIHPNCRCIIVDVADYEEEGEEPPPPPPAKKEEPDIQITNPTIQRDAKEAVASLPAHHAKMLKDLPIKEEDILSFGGKQGNAAGMYYPSSHSISIARNFVSEVSGAKYAGSNFYQTTLHELAHALDRAEGKLVNWGMSSDPEFQRLFKEAWDTLSPQQQKTAEYFNSNDLERFAETYTLAFGDTKKMKWAFHTDPATATKAFDPVVQYVRAKHG